MNVPATLPTTALKLITRFVEILMAHTCVTASLDLRGMRVDVKVNMCIKFNHQIGYTFFAVDIDECDEGIDNCGENEECVDEPGSYICQCISGYHQSNGSESCVGKVFNHSLHAQL